MAIFETNIKLDDKTTGKFISAIKNFFTGQPTWLTTILFLTLMFAGGYYLYSYKTSKDQLNELQTQLEKLNNMTNNRLEIDEYQKNMCFFIEEIKILDYILQQNYEEQLYVINQLILCIEEYHPDEHISKNLDGIKERMKLNNKLYKHHHDQIIKELNKISYSDSIK